MSVAKFCSAIVYSSSKFIPGLWGIMIVSLCTWSCETKSTSQVNKPKILVTTLMLQEGIAFMTEGYAEVDVLMGPGVDPHLYKPTPEDLRKMREADILILNGLHLEGRLSEITKALNKDKKVYYLSDYIPASEILYSGDIATSPDPHIWMAPTLWATGMKALGRALGAEFKQDSILSSRGDLYADSLMRLNAEIQAGLNKIPPSNRVLVTSHDAFRYFGKAYNWEVKGLQGISTSSDIGIREVRDLVSFLCQRRLPTVFPESSVSIRNLEAVVRACKEKGHLVETGPHLYTDAPGNAGTPEGTYSGMLKYNQEILSQWLQTR